MDSIEEDSDFEDNGHGGPSTSESSEQQTVWGDVHDASLTSLAPFLKTLPHSPDLRYLDAKLSFSVDNLDRPIGVCVLPSKNIVVGVTGENAVKMFSPEGTFLGNVVPNVEFHRPSDMAALPDGRFAVRDDRGIQLFDEEGLFLQNVAAEHIGKCYGLATDGRGNIITLNTNNGFGGGNTPTRRGETDVFVIDVESGRVTQRIELCEVISKNDKSKCRFLFYMKNKLYIVDLGLDQVYVMDLKNCRVRAFGKTGQGKGQFSDPAGIAVDRDGYMIVADSRNHRLQIFDKSKKYVGLVKLDRPLKRPSGIFFDAESEEPAIFVLNLWGKSLVKYILQL